MSIVSAVRAFFGGSAASFSIYTALQDAEEIAAAKQFDPKGVEKILADIEWYGETSHLAYPPSIVARIKLVRERTCEMREQGHSRS